MKNTLQDLNNHLKIATQIIENGELAFKTMVHMDEYGYNNGHQQVPVMLEARTQTGGD